MCYIYLSYSCSYHVVCERPEDAEGDGVVGGLVHVDDGQDRRGESADHELGAKVLIFKTDFGRKKYP
jgi:hypothetical protein